MRCFKNVSLESDNHKVSFICFKITKVPLADGNFKQKTRVAYLGKYSLCATLVVHKKPAYKIFDDTMSKWAKAFADVQHILV
jgi:hypothetical protein